MVELRGHKELTEQQAEQPVADIIKSYAAYKCKSHQSRNYVPSSVDI